MTGIAILTVTFDVMQRPQSKRLVQTISQDNWPHVPTLRERYPWNVVAPNDAWHPALSHPDALRVIEAALQDWLLVREDAFITNFYKHPPNRAQVRLLRFQLPAGQVPSIAGLGFSLQDQNSDRRDEALSGTAPGDIGFRFDSFRTLDKNTIELTMCLLEYCKPRPGWIDSTGSLSIRYVVRKSNGSWIAVLQSANS